MLESGIRLDEVTGLQLDDVHIKEMYLKVRSKGDEEATSLLAQQQRRR